MLLDSKICPAALKYIKSIRNKEKQKFARDYYRAKKYGMPMEFHKGVSIMVMQAVVMTLNPIIDAESFVL